MARSLLYYTRAVWSRRVQRALVRMIVVALASVPVAVAARQAPEVVPSAVGALAMGLTPRQEFYKHEAIPAIPPVELRFLLKPGPEDQAQRLVDSTRAALRRLSEWYGAFPFAQLTVIDAPWHSPWVGASYPGTVVTSTRWMSLERDASVERTLIGAIARQYWFGVIPADPAHGWFEEGLVQYSGARAIDVELKGRHYWSARYFGGFMPFAIRSLPLSPAAPDARPSLRRFDELQRPVDAPWRRWVGRDGNEAERTATALVSLERYIGWPAMQQGLEAYRERFRAGTGTPGGLATVLSEQRGRDLSWFFAEAFRFPARFDYGIEHFSSVPEGSRYRTEVKLRRFGDAVFAGTVEPREASRARSLEVSIRFEDGTDVREWWDGRDPAVDLDYLSASPAILASVDPDAMLLLDADPSNNRRTLRRGVHVNGVRETLSWLMWLQDLVLTYSALV